MSINTLKYLYRCENCNVILYKLDYVKKGQCNVCHNVLQIISINENSRFVDLLNNLKLLKDKIDFFESEISILNISEKGILFTNIESIISVLNQFKLKLQ